MKYVVVVVGDDTNVCVDIDSGQHIFYNSKQAADLAVRLKKIHPHAHYYVFSYYGEALPVPPPVTQYEVRNDDQEMAS